ncbi:MAG: 16S rRNA (cytosine(967)-C(5))-methyltransferase RsmB, partial [Clostridiales bacterium]|nr:16S rRNA (cytosine(967)-C(5))-methyltransferase RsmB [Clostridiales bacterium]
ISRGKDSIELPDKGTAEFISIKYSYPLWLVKMWNSKYEMEVTENICAAGNTAPDVCLAANTLKTSAEKLKADFENIGVKAKFGEYSKNSVHIRGSSDLSKTKMFVNGDFHVQDESSMLAVVVLAPKPGETVLDVCAAPGGKSFLAAEIMNNKGKIVSCDIHRQKIDLIEQTAARLGLDIIEIRLRDASVKHAEDFEKYDRVIVDVPCSGLGLIRKKPDIKLNKSGEDIDGLIKLQRKIIDSSLDCVKPGGILVYSTCTICKKENEMNYKYILDKVGFEPVDIRESLPENLREYAEDGYIQLRPDINNMDGFFISAVRKKGL